MILEKDSDCLDCIPANNNKILVKFMISIIINKIKIYYKFKLINTFTEHS